MIGQALNMTQPSAEPRRPIRCKGARQLRRRRERSGRGSTQVRAARHRWPADLPQRPRHGHHAARHRRQQHRDRTLAGQAACARTSSATTRPARNEMWRVVLDGFAIAAAPATPCTTRSKTSEPARGVPEHRRKIASCTFALDQAPPRADYVLVRSTATKSTSAKAGSRWTTAPSS